jgi:hypothetical protein
MFAATVSAASTSDVDLKIEIKAMVATMREE